ncbi:MAG: hypothetical protein D6770_11610 [Anaerolineae bacterium]|nr:MAG: hypothetical protein D6770_11610 [Anaerolineae bacterium]
MSVLERLASALGRRDDVPNQELAREVAAARDEEAVRELVVHLNDRDRNIQSDCIKVLYEIGYLAPELIADYADEFLALLRSRNNRLVWGGMIALSTIAALKAPFLYAHREEIMRAIEQGSVITQDRGIKALALVAAQRAEYREALFPYLLKHLATSRPKDVPQRAEAILSAVTAENREPFLQVLTDRMADLKPSQVRRVKKVIAATERR